MKESMYIKSITDVESFKLIKGDWDQLYIRCINNFYLTYNWNEFVFNYMPDALLNILAFYFEGKLVAIAPFCISIQKHRLGKYKTLQLIGNIYSPVRGFLVDSEYLDIVADKLCNYMFDNNDKNWSFISLDGLKSGDSFNKLFFEKLHAKNINLFTNKMYCGFSIDSCTSAKNIYANFNKNYKQNIRTCINRLNDNGNYKIILYDKGINFKNGIEDYRKIYKNSWKQNETYENFHIELADRLVKNNELKLYVLYYSDKIIIEKNKSATDYLFSNDCILTDNIEENYIPIAANYYIQHNNTAYFLKTAYIEIYKKYSPGTVLLWHSIQNLVDEHNVNLIDFQKGDEAYKKNWCKEVDDYLQLNVETKKSFFSKLEIYLENNIIPRLKKIKRIFQIKM